jgi:hypothetical protein
MDEVQLLLEKSKKSLNVPSTTVHFRYYFRPHIYILKKLFLILYVFDYKYYKYIFTVEMTAQMYRHGWDWYMDGMFSIFQAGVELHPFPFVQQKRNTGSNV